MLNLNPKPSPRLRRGSGGSAAGSPGYQSGFGGYGFQGSCDSLWSPLFLAHCLCDARRYGCDSMHQTTASTATSIPICRSHLECSPRTLLRVGVATQTACIRKEIAQLRLQKTARETNAQPKTQLWHTHTCPVCARTAWPACTVGQLRFACLAGLATWKRGKGSET